MQKDYSPFVPGQPVAPEFFVGRAEQVRFLVDRIRQTLSGRLETVFVSGERGIGKTSLVQFVRWDIVSLLPTSDFDIASPTIAVSHCLRSIPLQPPFHLPPQL